MRNKRWNPATRHTVLGEPGNGSWAEMQAAAARASKARDAEEAELLRGLREQINETDSE